MAIPKAKFTDECSPNMLQLIGRIAIASGQLEWLIFLTTKRLRGEALSEYRAKWDERKSVSQWYEQLNKDAAALDSPLRETLVSVVKCAKSIFPKRNDLFHGT
jgi:hypothetical protein